MNTKGDYYEVDVTMKVRPESNRSQIDGTTLGFMGRPTEADIQAKFDQRFPEFELTGIRRIWNASGKAYALNQFYAKGSHPYRKNNYDKMWNVSGYYNDNDGNDIRDRD